MLARKLDGRSRMLRAARTPSPPFGEMSDAERASLKDRMNASGGDVVRVGLRIGTVEHRMAENRSSLAPLVIIGLLLSTSFRNPRSGCPPGAMLGCGVPLRLAADSRIFGHACADLSRSPCWPWINSWMSGV